MNEKRSLGDHPVIIILGVVSACIAIFAFFTGFDNIIQIASSLFNIPSVNVDNTNYPEYQQENPVPTVDYQGLPSFGESRDINGLIVTVSAPNYDAGCDGTLEFEIILNNTTNAPIVLGFDSYNDLKLLGNGNDTMYNIYGDIGAASPRCINNFEVETLAPTTSTTLFVRTTTSLGDYKYLDLVFGENAGRLAGQVWRLDLSKQYEIPVTHFGETISKDGLEVTVGWENLFPGCDGTLGFMVLIKNTTSQPIVLAMSLYDGISLYGDNDTELDIYSDLGQLPTTECPYSYYGEIDTIQPNESITLAVINKRSLSGITYVDFVFEADNRLAGAKWRLILPR